MLCSDFWIDQSLEIKAWLPIFQTIGNSWGICAFWLRTDTTPWKFASAISPDQLTNWTSVLKEYLHDLKHVYLYLFIFIHHQLQTSDEIPLVNKSNF